MNDNDSPMAGLILCAMICATLIAIVWMITQ